MVGKDFLHSGHLDAEFMVVVGEPRRRGLDPFIYSGTRQVSSTIFGAIRHVI